MFTLHGGRAFGRSHFLAQGLEIQHLLLKNVID
jgi:hypothetical protein